jgi:hypothetical protein
MRNVRLILPIILVLLSVFPCARAQNRPPRFEIFAEGGGSFLNGGSALIPTTACPTVCTPSGCPPCPSGAVTSSFSKTGRLIAGARLRFTRHDALEASYAYSPNRVSVQAATGPVGSPYNRVGLISFNYVHYLWVKTPIQPFATAGLGANRFSGPQVVLGAPSGTWPFNSDNGYQFAWNYGGGADLVLRRHFALRVELRDYVTGQPSFITGTSHNIVPSAGIVFRFK